MRWPRLPGAWSPRIPHSSAGFLESGKRLQRIAGRSARRRAAGVRSEGSQGRFRMACYLYFPATPLEFLCSVIHLIASYSVIKPLITSVSPSGHRISTPQPDPGFFRATKAGRCSDILRICAAGGPVQASDPDRLPQTGFVTGGAPIDRVQLVLPGPMRREPRRGRALPERGRTLPPTSSRASTRQPLPH